MAEEGHGRKGLAVEAEQGLVLPAVAGGGVVVRVLLAQIGGEDPAAVILPTELIRRESA
ncbi:hypothetical protein ACFWFU_36580 [Streptomyces sp. NPDC060235]|uniref:hypothetical protein n=1 Tax=unclassified Streptomyces TaxID=2593676 RepID=UPI003669C161